MTPEFKEFKKISALTKMQMRITQKIHGTNAHILVYRNEAGELDLVCGKRTSYCYPQADNFGFAAFVHEHKQEFIEKLGEGRHDGEWAGPGINSGEGLTEKTFVLFDHWRWPPGRPLPPRTVVVPVLYEGNLDLEVVSSVMADLLVNGSKLVPGFMRPEGAVVSFGGERYKKVFNPEETSWTKGSGAPRAPRAIRADFIHLCQPVRLEKLLSRDEAYTAGYPETLPAIARDYIADLLAEGQIEGTDDEKKLIARSASPQIFKFIKQTIDEARNA